MLDSLKPRTPQLVSALVVIVIMLIVLGALSASSRWSASDKAGAVRIMKILGVVAFIDACLLVVMHGPMLMKPSGGRRAYGMMKHESPGRSAAGYGQMISAGADGTLPPPPM